MLAQPSIRVSWPAVEDFITEAAFNIAEFSGGGFRSAASCRSQAARALLPIPDAVRDNIDLASGSASPECFADRRLLFFAPTNC
jgi:hypothetical protein